MEEKKFGYADTGFSMNSYILVTLASLLVYIIYQRGLGERYNYPPGPIGLPLFGSLFSLILAKRPQHEVLNDWTRKFGDVISFKLLNTRFVLLNNEKMAHDVMGSMDVMSRMPVGIIKELTGTENAGIAFSNGQVWKEQRRFFLSVFKRSDSEGIGLEEIVGAQAGCVLAEIEKKNGTGFDPHPIVQTSISNIIAKIITGVTYEYDDVDFNCLMAHANRVFDLLGPAGLLSSVPILSALPTPALRQLTKEWDGVFDFIRKSIEDHKADFNPNQEPRDFIESYLQVMANMKTENNKGSFNETNLLACSFDLLLGGLETASTIISWALHTLASYPEEQRRVRREILDVIGQERRPRFSDRHKLHVTMATITECIRFRPSFDVQFAHVAENDAKVGGYDIPKGTVVSINMSHLLMSPSLWEEPLEFRPDRFLDEDGEYDRKREPIYFGTGRRVCPGEQLARIELFLIITCILQRFTISLAEGVPRDLSCYHSFTNRPDPFTIHAEK
nr:cytochrome P450 2D27-like [Lytechinus pictus]